MKAFIKNDKWKIFKHVYNIYFGFYTELSAKYYVKPLDENCSLIINNKTRQLDLVTPMGETPFMEVHKQFYNDLIEADFIEYKQGKFD